MRELPAALLGAELCLRAVYWGTCTKQKVAIFDGNSLGKGSFLKKAMSTDGSRREPYGQWRQWVGRDPTL